MDYDIYDINYPFDEYIGLRDCDPDKEIYQNHIYNIINDFIKKIQRIFSSEELEKILSHLLFDDNSTYKLNELDNSVHDFSQEPIFEHAFNKINVNVTGYYDIEGPILFYNKK